MVLGFLLGVLIAYILAFFNLDQTIIAGVKDVIKIDIGPHGYYFMLGVIGAISRIMIGGLSQRPFHRLPVHVCKTQSYYHRRVKGMVQL